MRARNQDPDPSSEPTDDTSPPTSGSASAAAPSAAAGVVPAKAAGRSDGESASDDGAESHGEKRDHRLTAGGDGLGTRIAASLRSRVAAMSAERDEVLRGEDPSAVHRMRVASRRVRAVLEVGAPWLEKRAAGRLLETARRAGRALGALREEQVTRTHFDRVAGASFGGEVVAADHVRMRLARRERRAARNVRREIEGKAITRMDGLAERAIARTPSGVRPTPEAVLRPIALRADEQIATARAAPGEGPLHEARIEAKRLRYALEAIAEKRGEALVDAIKSLQDAIGEYHDLTVLAACVEKERARAERDGCAALETSLAMLVTRTEIAIAEAEREAYAAIEAWPAGALERRTIAVAEALERAEQRRAARARERDLVAERERAERERTQARERAAGDTAPPAGVARAVAAMASRSGGSRPGHSAAGSVVAAAPVAATRTTRRAGTARGTSATSR